MADLFGLQLQAERLVWDMVKSEHYSNFGSLDWSLDRKTMFRLFCVFNRFCSTEDMRLPALATAFLCKKLRVPIAQAEFGYRDLLYHAAKNFHFGLVKAAKSLYDTYVREVLIEGRVSYSVPGDRPALFQPKPIRTHTVTTRELLVYDDNDQDPDQPVLNEPRGNVLHRIDLARAVVIMASNNKGVFNKAKKTLIQIHPCLSEDGSRPPCLELAFDSSKDMQKSFMWHQALQKATLFGANRTTNLDQTLKRLGLGKGDEGRVRSHSATEAPPFPSSKANNSSLNLTPPASRRKRSVFYEADRDIGDEVEVIPPERIFSRDPIMTGLASPTRRRRRQAAAVHWRIDNKIIMEVNGASSSSENVRIV